MEQTVVLFFLVLKSVNGLTTIPEPYNSVAECETAAEEFMKESYLHRRFCIPWKEIK
jgi:hypothetical protein